MEVRYRFFDHLSCKQIDKQVGAHSYHLDLEFKITKWNGKKVHYTFICWLGKAVVRRVSCVSSVGFLRGMLKIKAAWSHVAAVAVMR
jgi:hypothetical protein